MSQTQTKEEKMDGMADDIKAIKGAILGDEFHPLGIKDKVDPMYKAFILAKTLLSFFGLVNIAGVAALIALVNEVFFK